MTVFRGATVSIFGLQLPLMVQGYIGSLNIYLALPLLAATEINVSNLFIASLFFTVLGLLALEHSVLEWLALIEGNQVWIAPIVLAAIVCLMFLAVVRLCWLRHGRKRALLLAAFCAGMALYAKLPADHRTATFESGGGAPLPFTLLVFAGLALLLPMSLFLLFNVRTGEILASISQNLTTDYFGIDNTAIFENLIVRLS